MPRIRILLHTPIAIDAQKPPKPLMLDGILGYAWAIKNGYTKSPKEALPQNLILPDLPLKKISDNCFAASAAFVPEDALMQSEVVVKRTDWQQSFVQQGITGHTRDTGAGYLKGCMESYLLMVTPYIDFYYEGDTEKVIDLLKIIKNLGHIGAKRGAGYGRIKEIQLHEKAEDWAVWRNGIPTRQLPVSIVGERDNLIKEWTTYYPPYWATANNTWCYMPPASQWLPRVESKALRETVGTYFEEKLQFMKKRRKGRNVW